MNNNPLSSVAIGGNDSKMPAKPPHQSAAVLSTLVEPYIETVQDSEEGILITSAMLDQIVEIMRSRVALKGAEPSSIPASIISRTNPFESDSKQECQKGANGQG